MCGRYALISPAEAIRELDLLTEELVAKPRYNIAPNQLTLTVRQSIHDQSTRAVMMKWGLVPHWAKDARLGSRLINARAETIAQKPAFRDAFRKRRCLVLADGFYEWKTLSNGHKQPYFFQLEDRAPMTFAGLWELWSDHNLTLETFTIVTTQANQRVNPIHGRMPVILPPHERSTWLRETHLANEDLMPLLAPKDDLPLKLCAVNPQVNNPQCDHPSCIEPLELCELSELPLFSSNTTK